MITRRDWLRLTLTGTAAALAGAAPALAAAPTRLTVYKSPTCGCCLKWIDHARAAGFVIDAKDIDDLSEIKATLGVPLALQSCHTATTAGYVFEGHIPADLIARFLKQKPRDAAGLAVPGMPVGSPGMEMGAQKDAYDVVLLTRAGTTRVYARR